MNRARKQRDAALGEDLAHHCAVCRGEFCAVCDRTIANPPASRGLQLCQWCWPDRTVPWLPLHISLAWDDRDGWILSFSNRTAEDTCPKVSHWLLLHDRAECEAIMDRYLCCEAERAKLDGMSDRSGHNTVGIFVTSRRLAALVAATRRDPRTAYDKLKALGRL